MGVRGLTTYIDENAGSCVRVVDLIEEAKTREVKLVVDFYSFIGFLLPELYRNAKAYYGNEFLSIPGGDYLLYHHWIMRIVGDLKRAGITLVFYADGPLGASVSHKESKMPSLKMRHEETVKKMLFYLDICHQSISIEEFRLEDSMWPLLYDVQIAASLLEAGYEYNRLAFGEADYVIVHKFQSEGGYAVLSNDSDFAIFQGCVWMPLKYFDMSNSLKIRYLETDNTPYNMFENVELDKLLVGVVTNESMMEHLGLTWPQLFELSVLQGNDFSSPLIRKNARLWKETMRIPKSDPDARYPRLKDVATYVRGLPEGLANNPQFISFCKEVPEFLPAVEHAYKFYNLTLMASDARYKPGTITQTIEAFAPHLMGMHFGFYWHKVIVEDPNLIPVEILLKDVRASLYKILCNRTTPPYSLQVHEVGRSPRASLDSAAVYSGKPVQGMSFADQISYDKRCQNLETIQRIVLRHDAVFNENLVGQYGWRNGFICVCLRFFLTMNWRQNLAIDEEEFVTLVAMMFGTKILNVENYYSLRILPSVRCLTIYNWIQDVYRHIYYFFGAIFCVTDQLPPPKECLSAAIFFAFYMIRNPADVPNLSVEAIEGVRQDRWKLIHDKRHMIKKMTMLHFSFDTQFYKMKK